jgi:hypothetical protein
VLGTASSTGPVRSAAKITSVTSSPAALSSSGSIRRSTVR